MTYKILLILFGISFMHNGMSSVWGQTPQTPDTLDVKTSQTEHQKMLPDSLPDPQPVIAKAEVPDTTVTTDITALDSTAIGEKSDSLLRDIGRQQKRFIPNPQRALWLSLIIPGAGQIYNRKLWKIPIVYGGFLGCLYALTWNNQMYNDYSQAYLDIMDDDPNTKSYMDMLPLNFNMEGRENQYKEIFKNKKNYYRKYRDMSIFAMVGVYLLSVIDAYVDAELSSFDISEDLSLHVEPAVFNAPARGRTSSVGIQCKLNF